MSASHKDDLGNPIDVDKIRRTQTSIAEATYRSIIDNVVEGIFQTTADGRFVLVNTAMAQMLGYHSAEQLIAERTDIAQQGYLDPSRRAEFKRLLERDGMVRNFEYEAVRRDGSAIWVSENVREIRDANNGLLYYQGTMEDISERKHVEQALRESESHKSAILASALDAIITIDHQGMILEFNPAAEQIFGWKKHEAIGRELSDLVIPPRLRQRHRDGMARFVSTGEARVLGRRIEMPALRSDGTEFLAELSILRIGDTHPPMFTGFIRDITASNRAEQALKLAEAKYRSIFENAVEGIFQSLPSGRYITVNSAFARILGYDSPEDVIEYCTDIRTQVYVEPKDRDEFMRRLDESGVVVGFEHEAFRKDGSKVWVSLNASVVRNTVSAPDSSVHPIVYDGSIIDITHRKSLESQLRHMQKMESIGLLAGGVAHDFNNILMVVLGHADLLLKDESLSADARDSLMQIAEASERAATLTRQLLTFSRKQMLQPKVLDLNEVVQNMTKMLQRILGEDITLQVEYSPDSLRTHGDAGMMEQVLMNLAVNARDAMIRGGRLIIKTSLVEIDKDYTHQNAEAYTGQFVLLTVSDNGCGIPAEHLERIFEPFYTTKDIGKGTGLGLATAFGIIKQHKGWIEVQSDLGQGTIFRIYLPDSPAPREPEVTTTAPALRGGNETILIVEDEPALLELGRTTLERLGYEVLAAPSGRTALNVWKLRKDDIKLLLTDLVMPDGMTGLELAHRLLEEKAGLKVIYTSGYGADVVGTDFLVESGENYLQKPYRIPEMAQKVRACLDN